MTEENTTEESVVEEGSETEAEEPEGDHIDKMLEEAEIQPDISEMTLERETPEEKRQRILNNTRPERLTAEQKQLFSYFAKCRAWMIRFWMRFTGHMNMPVRKHLIVEISQSWEVTEQENQTE